MLVVIVDVLAGYAFARLRFPGRNQLFALTVASLIVPAEILLIPNYITVWRLGWLNSYNALIFPALAGGFGVFLMRQFMLGIPHELEDAASIDGCGSFRREPSHGRTVSHVGGVGNPSFSFGFARQSRARSSMSSWGRCRHIRPPPSPPRSAACSRR